MSELFFPQDISCSPSGNETLQTLWHSFKKKKEKKKRWITFYFTELDWRFIYCKNQSRCWEILMSFIIYVYLRGRRLPVRVSCGWEMEVNSPELK